MFRVEESRLKAHICLYRPRRWLKSVVMHIMRTDDVDRRYLITDDADLSAVSNNDTFNFIQADLVAAPVIELCRTR